MVVLLFHYRARFMAGFMHLVCMVNKPSDLIFVDMVFFLIHTSQNDK